MAGWHQWFKERIWGIGDNDQANTCGKTERVKEEEVWAGTASKSCGTRRASAFWKNIFFMCVFGPELGPGLFGNHPVSSPSLLYLGEEGSDALCVVLGISLLL